MSRRMFALINLIALVALLISGCTPAPTSRAEAANVGAYQLPATATPRHEAASQPSSPSTQEVATEAEQEEPESESAVTQVSDPTTAETISFTLETTIENGFAFRGVGGEIDGVRNPELRVPAGAQVQITLVNSDGVEHDLALDEFNVRTPRIARAGAEETIIFIANQGGEFDYYCTVPGHHQAGMVGKFIVEGEGTEQDSTASADETEPEPSTAATLYGEVEHPSAISNAATIAADPNVVPEPTGGREAQTVRVDLETIEMDGLLADGTTFHYWTFNSTVPGPMVRVQLGDTVEVHLKNDHHSAFAHSVDFHAATGYLGGGEVTQTAPGEETIFTFKALNPGVYVYHCATPLVAQHIANGMYGLIVVEPEGGLPPVDREFYIMQGEIYSTGRPGDTGHLDFDIDAMLAEHPNYLVFNGSTHELSGELALRANVGETVRIFMGVGGPNLTSSFHVIGEVFDRVYELASLTSQPLTNVQTALVPAGGATVVEFTLEQPGTYVLVDHALSRAAKGLKALLIVEGEADPAVSDGQTNGVTPSH